MGHQKTDFLTLISVFFTGVAACATLLGLTVGAIWIMFDAYFKPLKEGQEKMDVKMTNLEKRFNDEVFSRLEMDGIIGRKVASYMDGKNQKWYDDHKRWYDKVKKEYEE